MKRGPFCVFCVLSIIIALIVANVHFDLDSGSCDLAAHSYECKDRSDRSLFFGISVDYLRQLCKKSLIKGANPFHLRPTDFEFISKEPLSALELSIKLGNFNCTRDMIISSGAHLSDWVKFGLKNQEIHHLLYILKKYNPTRQRESIYMYRNLLKQNDADIKQFLELSSYTLDSWMSRTGEHSPLLQAVAQNDTIALELLVAQSNSTCRNNSTIHSIDGFGFDSNVHDEYGWSSIHLASWLVVILFCLLLIFLSFFDFFRYIY